MLFMRKKPNGNDKDMNENISPEERLLKHLRKQEASSPKKEAAKQKGISCLAITDHDTLGAFPEACGLSEAYKIELIEGIEISAQLENSEVHILGYFIDTSNPDLAAALSDIGRIRIERLMAMADKLSSLGLSIDKQKILEIESLLRHGKGLAWLRQTWLDLQLPFMTVGSLSLFF